MAVHLLHLLAVVLLDIGGGSDSIPLAAAFTSEPGARCQRPVSSLWSSHRRDGYT